MPGISSRAKIMFAVIAMMAAFFIMTFSFLIALLLFAAAVLLFAYVMIKDIKAFRNFSLGTWHASGHTPLSALTNKHCPNCNRLLYYAMPGGLPQVYVCRKCGYSGPIGLELKKNKKAKMAKNKKKQ